MIIFKSVYFSPIRNQYFEYNFDEGLEKRLEQKIDEELAKHYSDEEDENTEKGNDTQTQKEEIRDSQDCEEISYDSQVLLLDISVMTNTNILLILRYNPLHILLNRIGQNFVQISVTSDKIVWNIGHNDHMFWSNLYGHDIVINMLACTTGPSVVVHVKLPPKQPRASGRDYWISQTSVLLTST